MTNSPPAAGPPGPGRSGRCGSSGPAGPRGPHARSGGRPRPRTAWKSGRRALVVAVRVSSAAPRPCRFHELADGFGGCPAAGPRVQTILVRRIGVTLARSARGPAFRACAKGAIRYHAAFMRILPVWVVSALLAAAPVNAAADLAGQDSRDVHAHRRHPLAVLPVDLCRQESTDLRPPRQRGPYAASVASAHSSSTRGARRPSLWLDSGDWCRARRCSTWFKARPSSAPCRAGAPGGGARQSRVRPRGNNLYEQATQWAGFPVLAPTTVFADRASPPRPSSARSSGPSRCSTDGSSCR